jgi:hypothetical protein
VHSGEPNEELLEHLVVEFGDRGGRAVEFLRTAAGLLSSPIDPPPPRHAECVAYCLREALKTILASPGVEGGGGWRTRSRKVSEAKQRFEQIRGLPGADADGALRDLLDRIDDLALTFEQETIHQKRLIAVMVERTGAEPLASGTKPVNTYQGLLARLDEALHTEVTLEAVAGLWVEALAILRQLFLPPDERHQELTRLAALEKPTRADVVTLKSLLAAPSHLQYFLARINDPDWLELLDSSGLLEPLGSHSVWPVFAAVERLRNRHAGRLSALLAAMFERWGADPEKAFAIARAAFELGADGRDLVLRSAQRHPAAPALAWLAVEAAQKADPADEFVQQVADQAVSSVIQAGVDLYLTPLLDSYAKGVTAENHAARVQILCYKLVKVPGSDRHRRDLVLFRGGSITDPPDHGEDDPFPSLIRALVESLRRAAEFTTVSELLEAVSALPADLRDRLRAWILGTWEGATPGLLTDEVTQAISSRAPTGDDLRLVDAAVQRCAPEEYAGAWSAALGEPPTIAESGAALAAHEVPEEWTRAFQWAALLPGTVTAAWASVITVLAGAYGEPSRAALEQRPRVLSAWGNTPISEDELRAMTPHHAARLIATWRPDPARPLTGSRELARALETVVKSDPASWAATPLRTGGLLHEPMYLSHYMRGLAEAEVLHGVPLGELVDLIVLTSTHPWEPTAMGDPTYDYDPDWQDAESAAVALITALARNDLGFAGREEEIWDFLDHQARARDQVTRMPDSDPFTQAVNRPCTRALQAMFDVMGHEYRDQKTVRPEALDLVAETLALSGPDGAQHRAIIAPRLAFLRYVAPTWVDDHRGQLFGADAPDNLGQTTVDLALSWGRPNSWLLEHFGEQVRDAVRRTIDNALDHYLVAMLWQVPGYSLDEAVTVLRSLGRLSDAGQALGRLLGNNDASAEHAALAAQFWEKSIERGSVEILAGFGQYAEISALDDTTWARLTRQTLNVTRGHIDWARHVAERAARPQPTPDTLEILNQLLRGLPDGWDQRSVAETAALAIKKAAPSHRDTPEYQRLHTTLLERGVDLALPDLRQGTELPADPGEEPDQGD